MKLLPTVAADSLSLRRPSAFSKSALDVASDIVAAVWEGGLEALFKQAQTLAEVTAKDELFISKVQLQSAFESLTSAEQLLLKRTAERISLFAKAQRNTLADLDTAVPGGRAGHRILPLRRAGCYAPGGRYPLPSSVLMTACVAVAAGVEEVVVASPRPSVHTLAAAYVAGATEFLAAGGAQAIAALAYGVDGLRACDIVVGPGNQYVTAAKYLVSADVGIDMLAGPSELLIVADETACSRLVAADLIAQAEHDPLALPLLVTLHKPLISRIREELEHQLRGLATADIATQALLGGKSVVASSRSQACDICNAVAPEHLELHVAAPQDWISTLRAYGSLFIGAQSAEVVGDYGVGPNHVLPTGASARYRGGLSVLTFLRVATWLQMESSSAAASMLKDSAELARLEGLEGHARAAELRLKG